MSSQGNWTRINLSLVNDVKDHVGMFVSEAVTHSGHVGRVVCETAIRLDHCQWYTHARRPTDLTTFVHLQHTCRSHDTILSQCDFRFAIFFSFSFNFSIIF